ncbi:MAG: insulinase family protein [Candidatus Rokubacteria bacterium]|nr:insulinase family protein [Candidatus Rokubacteria bacterium]
MSQFYPLAAAAITLFADGGAVSAPSPARSAPAVPERLRLDNGLTVIFGEHRAADVVAVQLWMRVGARDETDAESGLSHFVEHLFFKGTPTRGPGVIDRTISGLGGEINAATSQDFTYYHIVVPARHVETALDVVADAAQGAAFDAGELDRERLVVLEEIRRSRDNPSAHLWRVLARHHFAGHPYSRDVLGSPDIIQELLRERIVEYYRRHYVPDNATVVVIGNVDRKRTLGHVRRAFAGWEPRPGPPSAISRAADLSGLLRVAEPRPLQQAYLGVAWRGPTAPQADVYAVDLLASILGGRRTSRLQQVLKEQRGLVSSIGSRFYAQRSAGTIAVTARTSAAQQQEVEDALVAEIERLRTTPVGEGELARALTATEAGYAFGHETAEGVAYSYGMAETVWTLEFELGYLDETRKVTRGQVQEAARRYLTPDRFTLAVLTPTNGHA